MAKPSSLAHAGGGAASGMEYCHAVAQRQADQVLYQRRAGRAQYTNERIAPSPGGMEPSMNSNGERRTAMRGGADVLSRWVDVATCMLGMVEMPVACHYALALYSLPRSLQGPVTGM